MEKDKQSRIVFTADEEEARRLTRLAKNLRQKKIATVRFAVSILAMMVDEIQNGGEIILLRGKDGKDRQITFPQIAGNRARPKTQ